MRGIENSGFQHMNPFLSQICFKVRKSNFVLKKSKNASNLIFFYAISSAVAWETLTKDLLHVRKNVGTHLEALSSVKLSKQSYCRFRICFHRHDYMLFHHSPLRFFWPFLFRGRFKSYEHKSRQAHMQNQSLSSNLKSKK